MATNLTSYSAQQLSVLTLLLYTRWLNNLLKESACSLITHTVGLPLPLVPPPGARSWPRLQA